MKLITNLRDFPSDLQGGAISIGNFDGVHLGHASIIAHLRQMASRVGGPTVVFTFDPHPVRLLRADQIHSPLTWTKRKAELLAELGVDGMIAYPTDEALLSLSAREFFDRLICDKLRAKGIVEGPNFFFGRNRSGTVETLRSYCGERQMLLDVVEPLVAEGDTVSSSRIRRLIQSGRAGEARCLLTQPYRIRGMITHGAARGSRIGFPTANLDAIDTMLPGLGVYAARAIVDGQPWAAAVNVGTNPTFGEHAIKVEAHLVGFSRDVYGQPMTVDFLDRLRDIHPFASVDALKQQLEIDVANAARIEREIYSK